MSSTTSVTGAAVRPDSWLPSRLSIEWRTRGPWQTNPLCRSRQRRKTMRVARSPRRVALEPIAARAERSR
jgi:hypothetical protein